MEKLIEKAIIDYVDDVDSTLPAPGGGSVAALAGALGSSLARMAAHLSFDKKKFNDAPLRQRNQFILAFKELEYYKDSLLNGVDDDAISYDAVIAAFKTKDEEQIQSALLASAMTAYEMQECSCKALYYCEKLIDLANKYLYSDIISGAILLASCTEMAALNVKANANMLKDENLKKTYLLNSENLVKKAKTKKNQIINKINKI